jgi:ribosomal protein S18 acetylase RimI-like enzyme
VDAQQRILWPDFNIRGATEHDAAGILACLRTAFEAYRTSYTPEAFRDTVLSPEGFQQRLTSTHIFVALQGDSHIIGTVCCALVSSDEGHLRGMAVLPDCQRLGIAEKLLQAAEAELVGSKCSRVTLDTTEPLQRAMHFYEKNGYRASGKITDFFGMPLHEYVKELTVGS